MISHFFHSPFFIAFFMNDSDKMKDSFNSLPCFVFTMGLQTTIISIKTACVSSVPVFFVWPMILCEQTVG